MPGRALPHIKPRTLALWLSATLNPVPSIRPGNNHASHHQRICSHARPYRPNCGHYICCVLVRYVLDHLDELSMQSRLKNVCRCGRMDKLCSYPNHQTVASTAAVEAVEIPV